MTVLRNSLLDLLRLLGDPVAQLDYERDVSIAHVQAELICMWFDDQYHPATDQFQAAFSPSEQAVLAAFHRRFLKIADSLPRDIGRVAQLHAHAKWQTLMRDATDTVRSLGAAAG